MLLGELKSATLRSVVRNVAQYMSPDLFLGDWQTTCSETFRSRVSNSGGNISARIYFSEPHKEAGGWFGFATAGGFMGLAGFFQKVILEFHG